MITVFELPSHQKATLYINQRIPRKSVVSALGVDSAARVSEAEKLF